MLLKIKQKLEEPLFCMRLFSILICLRGLMGIAIFIIIAAIVAIPSSHIEGSNIFLRIVQLFTKDA